MNNHFNMRIAKRIGDRYKFGTESIDNVPYIDLFIDKEDNIVLTNGCKEVLYKSMNSKSFPYGEQGLLVSVTDTKPKIHINIGGNYRRVRANLEYKQTVYSRQCKDLVFIHNHPNNSNFSYNDLISFSLAEQLVAIIAIGNTRNVHTLLSTGSKNNIAKFIRSYKHSYKVKHNIKLDDESADHIIEYEAVNYILSNCNKFNIEYRKFNRRSLK